MNDKQAKYMPRFMQWGLTQALHPNQHVHLRSHQLVFLDIVHGHTKMKIVSKTLFMAVVKYSRHRHLKS